MGKIRVHNTNGKEAVERASLAFVVAKTALNSGQEATVLLTIEGVCVNQRVCGRAAGAWF